MSADTAIPVDLAAIRLDLAEIEQRWTDPDEDLYGLLGAAGKLFDGCRALLAELERLAGPNGVVERLVAFRNTVVGQQGQLRDALTALADAVEGCANRRTADTWRAVLAAEGAAREVLLDLPPKLVVSPDRSVPEGDGR